MRQEDHETLASALAHLDSRLGTLAAAVRQVLDAGEVLATETWQLGADGVLERSWQVEFRSVSVTNLSTQPVTVNVGGRQSAAAASGPGVAVVAAGKSSSIPLAGHALTLYGQAAGTVVLSVFGRPQSPAWG